MLGMNAPQTCQLVEHMLRAQDVKLETPNLSELCSLWPRGSPASPLVQVLGREIATIFYIKTTTSTTTTTTTTTPTAARQVLRPEAGGPRGAGEAAEDGQDAAPPGAPVPPRGAGGQRAADHSGAAAGGAHHHARLPVRPEGKINCC